MSPHFMFLLAFIHAGIALVTTGANLYINHRRFVGATRNDMTRLRLELAAELANLRMLCKDNIDALYGEKDVLASCRMFCAIYRGNLGRLHTLAAEHIPPVVTAFAMCERAEAYAAAYCKAHGQSAFSMGKERPFAETLIAMYEKAAAASDRALRALGEPDGALAEPGERAGAEVARLAAA